MHDIALQSGWETLLLAAPFIGMVLIGIFRLDEIATNSRRGQRPRFNGTSLNENDENGQILLPDPDGRPWPNSGPGFGSHSPGVTTPVN